MKKQLLTALAVLGAAGCSDEQADPTSADLAGGLLPCVFGAAASLEVGETLSLRGNEAGTLCLQAGSGGAEYTLVPFLANTRGDARLDVEAVGANLVDPLGPPNPTLLPGVAAAPRRDHVLHRRLMERSRASVAPLLKPAGGAMRSIEAEPTIAAAVPTVGSNITIRIPQFYRNQDPCNSGVIRQARVGAVTERAILVTDVANPTGGLTDAELLAFGREFDQQIYPLDTQYFGTPTDLDANGRVIIAFTREVNALTPPGSGGGYVGGFFFAGDLFPLQATARQGACPRSNVGEIFYLLAPDPAGAVNGNRRSRELVLQSAAGTIAHELEHLINASRRIFVNDAEEFEDAWLDEALAHSAEEINFYAASGLSPRRNLTLAQISAPPVANAVDRYMLDNFGRYLTYLEAPDSNSVIGPDLLETRGGSWAFLRYAADRKGTGDQPFFFSLVNSKRTGLENLSQVIGATGLDWVQDWTMAVYTDDAVPGVDARYVQPSWNFRDIMPRVSKLYGGPERFPLQVHVLGSANQEEIRLRGGGAAYLRFGIGPSARVGLRLTSKEQLPPSSLRFTLVRTR